MLKKFISYLFSFFMILSLFELAPVSYSSSKRIKLTVSFYPMYFFASRIGGKKVDIKTLIPSGVEPHDWEPKIKDMQSVANSNIFIYNGAGMESWIDKVTSQGNKKLIIVDSSKGVRLIKNTSSDEIKEHGNYDPHIWNSLKNAKIQSKNIERALIKASPKNKSYFEKNYNILIKELDKLDQKFSSKLKNLRITKIVTAHSAFAYLCKDYNLTQISIEGAFAEGEPSPKKMAEVVEICKKNKIKYVFSEELLSPKSAETIAKECNAKNLVLNPLESAGDGQDYLSIMQRNLSYLVKALK